MKIMCWLLGHRYQLVKELTPWSRRISCSRCKRHFGMNDNVQVVIDWTPELEDLYRTLGVDFEVKKS